MRVRWFLRVFGLALLACPTSDLANGVWHIHDGTAFPWRHLPVFPLYGTGGLILEWTALALAGALLVIGHPRLRAPAIYLGTVAMFVSILERYANNRALLLVVLAFLSLAPPRDDAPDSPNLTLCRAQLVIVYVFTALDKLVHGFAGGAIFATLGARVHGQLAPDWLRDRVFSLGAPLGIATIAVELAIPVMLALRPTLGLVLVILVHTSFALLLPGLWPFSLGMIALATLWQPRVGRKPSAGRILPQ